MPGNEVQRVIFQTLEGHLRSILGTLTVEEINNDRQSFAQKLTSEAAVDLERMGIGVDVLTIQEISDEEGYLDALGKRRTAEVKRDAQIGESEAMRDSKIKASVAMQEGEKVKLESEANIAESQRSMEVKKAQYLAEIERERATAEQAGPLASARARQAVVVEEIRVDKARTQEQIAVASPIGAIDKVVVIEQGSGANGQSNGMGGIGRFAAAAPSVVFGLLQQLEAVGLDVSGLLKQVGIAQNVDSGKPVIVERPQS
ncbi:MAG TPA: SPFH domain-containing protein [Blastocatellia bacterium]|nr:SPFH domain-containing protein [Blastocatellia bacterium]